MSIKKDKRISLLRYWTTRYVLTLMIGLIVIAIVSALWIRHTTIQHRLELTVFMAEEMANRMVSKEQRLLPREETLEFFERHRLERSTFIVDTQGNIISANRMPGRLFLRSISPEFLEASEQIQSVQLDEDGNQRFYVVKAPIQTDYLLLGWVVIFQSEREITEVNQEYSLLLVMLISLALLGWAAIYFLSRKLATPIKEIAVAAKDIQDGKYEVHLPDDLKEQEMFELVSSFKEMVNRLQHLESLRTELLAGVTHELKTPVTSISGLLQALKDDVVTGDDAKEFLALSLKETSKMQKMVEDLLAFNSFAANTIPVKTEKYELNELLEELLHEWRVVQSEDEIQYQLNKLNEPCYVQVDVVRLQQILVNLLRNAKQAIEGDGYITIEVFAVGENVAIDVKDTGPGISNEEQAYIFERFYRGEQKKYKIRGLGLGLPFSKMIAHALGGDLVLKNSSKDGTTFRITLPKVK